MNMKVAQAVAIGIGLVTLILVPSDMLDVVRWGAVAAILVAVAWHYYRGQTPRQMPAAEPAPRDATLSAGHLLGQPTVGTLEALTYLTSYTSVPSTTSTLSRVTGCLAMSRLR